MNIGEKIKARRQSLGLTQSELADRAELSKGFISQLERDLTSPSIATLTDILECLGTDLPEFFNEREEEKVAFSAADLFEKVDDDKSILWLVPNAQKNKMEPILLHLKAGCSTELDHPHEGEEFGYVLAGSITLVLGMKRHKIRKGGSFYFKATVDHKLENTGKKDAEVIWLSTPPMF
jgi:transcriptional regulator with XRE-family HTH domain